MPDASAARLIRRHDGAVAVTIGHGAETVVSGRNICLVECVVMNKNLLRYSCLASWVDLWCVVPVVQVKGDI